MLEAMSQTSRTIPNGDASMIEPIFGTMVPAMVTPFTDDGELDLNAAQSLANHLVDNGADGLVVTGTTGETSTLTDDAIIHMFEADVKAVNGLATDIVGTVLTATLHLE